MQQLQLSIPEPCHENWQQMPPSEKGRFCNACAKEVVDFSTMTDMQVLNYFTTYSNQQVCGRMLPEQLDRTISRPVMQKRKLYWYWNYFVAMLLVFFTKSNAAKAQGTVKQRVEVIKNKENAKKAIADWSSRMSRKVNGKVNDKFGNPIPFASITIKGTNTGVSADANGDFTLRVQPGAILNISAAGFKTFEIPVREKSALSIVMKQDCGFNDEVVVTIAGRISQKTLDEYRVRRDLRREATFQVKDENTSRVIPGASILIKNSGCDEIDSVFTNNIGEYNLKLNLKNDYEIKVSAPGYDSIEFIIDQFSFKDRKKGWEILLRKQKITASEKFTIRCHKVNQTERLPLFVIDGVIVPGGIDINPADVEDQIILLADEAMLIYGRDGANGAIVITTRKAKEIILREVILSAEFGITRKCRNTVCVSEMTQAGENAKAVVDYFTKSRLVAAARQVNVYPNPARPGMQLNIAFQLQQNGLHRIQITDMTGRVVLQRLINATSKEVSELISTDPKWGSGLYYITIFDNKNNPVNKSSFIVR